MDTVERYIKKMYGNDPDFVYSVTRDFVKSVHDAWTGRASGT
jgi:hypothetical protein